MTGINKHLSTIVLTAIAVGTILNKYVIIDSSLQWFLSMLLLSIYLVIYSYSHWKRNKKIINLVVLIIFISEMLGVLMGFNLSTNFFPELIISLCVIGLITKLKK